MIWLCNYGLKGPKASTFGARHCPFKYGKEEVCLFPEGPFDPSDDDDEPSVA